MVSSDKSEAEPVEEVSEKQETPEGLYSNGKVRPDWWRKTVANTVDDEEDEIDWLTKVCGKRVYLKKKIIVDKSETKYQD